MTFEAYATEPTEALGAPATFTISVATSWETQVTMNPDPVIITIGANQVPPVASTTATLTFMPGFDISHDTTLLFDSDIDFPALRQKLETGRMQLLARDDITVTSRVLIPFFDQARFIEGDRIHLRVRFSGAFSSTTNGILQLYLDDDLREVICDKGSGITSSLACTYVVQAGDFADMIRIPVQENLFPDAVLTRYYSGDAVTVNSAITTEQTLSRQVRGGVNYIELLTDRESVQEGVGATGVKVQATILQGPLPTDDIEIPLVPDRRHDNPCRLYGERYADGHHSRDSVQRLRDASHYAGGGIMSRRNASRPSVSKAGCRRTGSREPT